MDHWKINNEARKFYNLLADVNIMFDNPIDAGKWLNSNYNNIYAQGYYGAPSLQASLAQAYEELAA